MVSVVACTDKPRVSVRSNMVANDVCGSDSEVVVMEKSEAIVSTRRESMRLPRVQGKDVSGRKEGKGAGAMIYVVSRGRYSRVGY